MSEAECNGVCLTPSDLGLPEYDGPGIVAYAHPDCPLHGFPVTDDSDWNVCTPGEEENMRYVREEDCG